MEQVERMSKREMVKRLGAHRRRRISGWLCYGCGHTRNSDKGQCPKCRSYQVEPLYERERSDP